MFSWIAWGMEEHLWITISQKLHRRAEISHVASYVLITLLWFQYTKSVCTPPWMKSQSEMETSSIHCWAGWYWDIGLSYIKFMLLGGTNYKYISLGFLSMDCSLHPRIGNGFLRHIITGIFFSNLCILYLSVIKDTWNKGVWVLSLSPCC